VSGHTVAGRACFAARKHKIQPQTLEVLWLLSRSDHAMIQLHQAPPYVNFGAGMSPRRAPIMMLVMLIAGEIAHAQKAPASPDRPWDVAPRQQQRMVARPTPAFTPDPAKTYTLPELVDIAEHNNPETFVAWENAKARAADLGIAKASLYPTLAAAALAENERINIFFSPNYFQQILWSFSPAFILDYTIFDFGRRSDAVSIGRDNLRAANFQFNDAHRKIIFLVMQSYYRLLNSMGQQDAAEANLKNAQTVQEAAEARLARWTRVGR